MTKQHSHTTIPFTSKKFPITIICDGLQSPANIGALFRISDAFGVAEIIFSASKIDFSSNRLLRTARGTVAKTAFRETQDVLSEIQQLKAKGTLVIALEVTQDSIPLEALTLSEVKQTLLLIGNEQVGISDALLEQADHTVHIEMYGQNSSMNVVQATGIALYSMTNSLKQLVE